MSFIALLPNCFVSGANSGRFNGNQGHGFSSPGHAGHQTPRTPCRQITNANSPHCPVAQGHGPAPPLPQFTTDEHYFQRPQGFQPMNNYYEYGQGQDKMYYGQDSHKDYNKQGQEDYYEGEGMENQDEGANDTTNQVEEEAHFLQDFGY